MIDEGGSEVESNEAGCLGAGREWEQRAGDGEWTKAWRRVICGRGAGVYKQNATSHVERCPTPELRTVWERPMAICPISGRRKAHQYVNQHEAPTRRGRLA